MTVEKLGPPIVIPLNGKIYAIKSPVSIPTTVWPFCKALSISAVVLSAVAVVLSSDKVKFTTKLLLSKAEAAQAPLTTFRILSLSEAVTSGKSCGLIIFLNVSRSSLVTKPALLTYTWFPSTVASMAPGARPIVKIL